MGEAEVGVGRCHVGLRIDSTRLGIFYTLVSQLSSTQPVEQRKTVTWRDPLGPIFLQRKAPPWCVFCLQWCVWLIYIRHRIESDFIVQNSGTADQRSPPTTLPSRKVVRCVRKIPLSRG